MYLRSIVCPYELPTVCGRTLVVQQITRDVGRCSNVSISAGCLGGAGEDDRITFRGLRRTLVSISSHGAPEYELTAVLSGCRGAGRHKDESYYYHGRSLSRHALLILQGWG